MTECNFTSELTNILVFQKPTGYLRWWFLCAESHQKDGENYHNYRRSKQGTCLYRLSETAGLHLFLQGKCYYHHYRS